MAKITKFSNTVVGHSRRLALNLASGDVGYLMDLPARVPFTLFGNPSGGGSIKIEICMDGPEAVQREIDNDGTECIWLEIQAAETDPVSLLESRNFTAARFTAAGGRVICGVMYSLAT